MKLLAASAWMLRKDLRLYFRDRLGLALGLLLPIALVTVFGMVMQFAFGGGGGMPKVELWVVDDDRSATSTKFVAALRDLELLRVRPRAGEDPVGADAARRKVVDGEAHHVLIVGAGYGERLAAGQEPPLVLVRDPGRTMEARLVGIGLMQATMAAADGKGMPWLLASVMRRQGMSDDGVARVRAGMELVQGVIDRFAGGDAALQAAPGAAPDADAGGFDFASTFANMVPVVREDVRPPSRPKNLHYQLAQSVAGMTVMMLMFGLMACSVTLLQERDQGTLRRLLVTGAPRGSLLLGKFLFCVVAGLLQLAILFAYGEAVFRVGTFRDPVTLAVLSLTWAAAATSFGMLVAVCARTQKQAEGLSVMLILVMAALGGCWFPLQIADLPWWADVVTHATITHWAMTAFQGMFWQQQAFTEPAMLRAIGVLWLFTAVASFVAWRVWRRRYLAG